MEFEWNIFPGFAALQILAEIQKMMDEMQCEPKQFTGRIIFMYRNKEKKSCMTNSKTVAGYAK